MLILRGRGKKERKSKEREWIWQRRLVAVNSSDSSPWTRQTRRRGLDAVHQDSRGGNTYEGAALCRCDGAALWCPRGRTKSTKVEGERWWWVVVVGESGGDGCGRRRKRISK